MLSFFAALRRRRRHCRRPHRRRRHPRCLVLLVVLACLSALRAPRGNREQRIKATKGYEVDYAEGRKDAMNVGASSSPPSSSSSSSSLLMRVSAETRYEFSRVGIATHLFRRGSVLTSWTTKIRRSDCVGCNDERRSSPPISSFRLSQTLNSRNDMITSII